MVSRTSTKAEAPKPKKTKSKGGARPKKKLTPFNMFMRTELRRLKESLPDLTHKERFAAAVGNWNKLKNKREGTADDA